MYVTTIIKNVNINEVIKKANKLSIYSVMFFL